MPAHRIIVVGAGVGGLTAALILADAGCDVTVCEQAGAPGGKMREVTIDGIGIDCGPTVFTMRWVFDEILSSCGYSLDEIVTLTRAETLARHAWDGERYLDLFADIDRSEAAIGDFAGAGEARGFRAFSAAAAATYGALEKTFLTAERPSAPGLVGRLGISGLRRFTQASPFATLWSELGRYFADPRLRQLFGRYATYVGSSPFASPATLMLIAHVEQQGVWLVEGGMHRLARGLASLAGRSGASIRYASPVESIIVSGKGAAGVTLASGERLTSDAVVFNGDNRALATGLLGEASRRAVKSNAGSQRSLSALTWAMRANTSGLPLARHTVLFSASYADEFAALTDRRIMPSDPTVYVCAQDRSDDGALADRARSHERLLCLINAPAEADSAPASNNQPWNNPQEIARCHDRMIGRLAACGLTLDNHLHHSIATTPADFAKLFPASGGALYGQASHGWMSAFQRPRARSSMPSLYLAGGSTHPGAGVPMAAISGKLAAESLLADLTSRRRYHPAAMPGGTSTG